MHQDPVSDLSPVVACTMIHQLESWHHAGFGQGVQRSLFRTIQLNAPW
ncbi:MAG: hypothetical protein ACRDSR_06620 [Pseudonocardiaceae bacterium]